MTRSVLPKRSMKPSRPAYVLEEQVGFILRQVWQRHDLAIADLECDVEQDVSRPVVTVEILNGELHVDAPSRWRAS